MIGGGRGECWAGVEHGQGAWKWDAIVAARTGEVRVARAGVNTSGSEPFWNVGRGRRTRSRAGRDRSGGGSVRRRGCWGAVQVAGLSGECLRRVVKGLGARVWRS